MVKCPACGRYDYNMKHIKARREKDESGEEKVVGHFWQCGCGHGFYRGYDD